MVSVNLSRHMREVYYPTIIVTVQHDPQGHDTEHTLLAIRLLTKLSYPWKKYADAALINYRTNAVVVGVTASSDVSNPSQTTTTTYRISYPCDLARRHLKGFQRHYRQLVYAIAANIHDARGEVTSTLELKSFRRVIGRGPSL